MFQAWIGIVHDLRTTKKLLSLAFPFLVASAKFKRQARWVQSCVTWLFGHNVGSRYHLSGEVEPVNTCQKHTGVAHHLASVFAVPGYNIVGARPWIRAKGKIQVLARGWRRFTRYQCEVAHGAYPNILILNSLTIAL